ncbi:hypothetical protein ES705_11463 [subsurface metagenome]
MVRKSERSAESYTGNTAEARKMQRSNLMPGGKEERRKIRGARYDCWWELSTLRDKQSILKTYKNDRASKDVPKEELKSVDYLNNWWRDLSLESKVSIYKKRISGLTKEARAEIFKDMEECLKAKLRKGI